MWACKVSVPQHVQMYVCTHVHLLSLLPVSLQTLCNVILYCLLAPYDNEQSDLLHRLQKDKLLEDMPAYGELVKVFVTQEIVGWSTFEAQFGPVLKEGTTDDPCTGVFTKFPDYWQELSKRVVEHVSAWQQHTFIQSTFI